MEVINLKETGSQIPNLYQYEVIAKMNDHHFVIVRVKRVVAPKHRIVVFYLYRRNSLF
jgi:hypothetical protein